MKNIELAKNELKKKENKLVVVQNNEVVFVSRKNGIVPMYDFYNSGISGKIFIADKFIGSGAAKLLIQKRLKIEELYAQIISESALEILKKENVKISYDKKVEKILNRTGDDLCPIEKISQESDNFESFYKELHTFFKNTRQI